VADTSRDEDSHILDGQPVEQTTQVDKTVHHLSNTEAVAEVVKRVVAVVLLYKQLNTNAAQAPSGDSLCSAVTITVYCSTQIRNTQ